MCIVFVMSNLSSFLESNGISQRKFAGEIDVDPSIVSRLCKKLMRPSLELAFVIERQTGGAVPASSWVEDVQK